jgi:hypothetical protein
MDEWLTGKSPVWAMVVTFALSLIAALVNLSEKAHPPHR